MDASPERVRGTRGALVLSAAGALGFAFGVGYADWQWAVEQGAVQTAAFEIEGDLIRALYVVRNPDKLRHLASIAASSE